MSDNEIKNKVSNNLKDGKPVIIHVLGEERGGNSTYTTSEHWMTIVDIDEETGKVYLSNPNSTGESGWVDIDKVLTSVEDVIICN